MNRPTTSDVKTWSRVDFTDLDEPFEDTDLDILVLRSNDYVEDVTGRPLDATMPSTFVSIAQQCVQMRTEQLAFQSQPDYAETGSDDLVSSFTAGGYSETRDGPPSARAGVQDRFPPVNSWGALNSLLWMLMTQDQQDYWMEVLQILNRPTFETTEVDWSTMGDVYTTLGGGLVWGA